MNEGERKRTVGGRAMGNCSIPIEGKWTSSRIYPQTGGGTVSPCFCMHVGPQSLAPRDGIGILYSNVAQRVQASKASESGVRRGGIKTRDIYIPGPDPRRAPPPAMAFPRRGVSGGKGMHNLRPHPSEERHRGRLAQGDFPIGEESVVLRLS